MGRKGEARTNIRQECPSYDRHKIVATAHDGVILHFPCNSLNLLKKEEEKWYRVKSTNRLALDDVGDSSFSVLLHDLW